MKHIKRLSGIRDNKGRPKDVSGKNDPPTCEIHCQSSAPPSKTCVRGGNDC